MLDVKKTLDVPEDDSTRVSEPDLGFKRDSVETTRILPGEARFDFSGGEDISPRVEEVVMEDEWEDAKGDEIFSLEGVTNKRVIGLGAKTVLLEGKYQGEKVYKLAKRLNSSGNIPNIYRAVYQEYEIFDPESPWGYDAKDYLIVTDITEAMQAYVALSSEPIFKDEKIGVVYFNSLKDNYVDFSRVTPQLLDQILPRFTTFSLDFDQDDEWKLMNRLAKTSKENSQTSLFVSGAAPIIITTPLTPVDVEFLLLLRTMPGFWQSSNFRNLYFNNLGDGSLVHLQVPFFLPTLVLHNQDLGEMKKFEALDWPIVVVSGNTKLPFVDYGCSVKNSRGPRVAKESRPRDKRVLEKLETQSFIPDLNMPPEGRHRTKLFIFQKVSDDLVVFTGGSEELTRYESRIRVREILRQNLEKLLNHFRGSILVLDETTIELILELQDLSGISSFVFRNKYAAREFKKRNPDLTVYEPAENQVELVEVQIRSRLNWLKRKFMARNGHVHEGQH